MKTLGESFAYSRVVPKVGELGNSAIIMASLCFSHPEREMAQACLADATALVCHLKRLSGSF